MKAVLLRRTGGPEVLDATDLPMPEPGPGEARIRAASIGVGRPDALIRSGRYKWMPPLPAILGNEMAGVVDAVGAGVTNLARGQHVLLSARELPTRGGCYAEYACAPAGALYLLPDGIGFDDAVSLPNFQLAHALLFHCGNGRLPRSVLPCAQRQPPAPLKRPRSPRATGCPRHPRQDRPPPLNRHGTHLHAPAVPLRHLHA
jgi:NADPH:quinone reductase